MINKAWGNDEDYQRVKKERLQTLKEVCINCESCKKYKKNPGRPTVGLPMTSNFNEVLSMDIGKLEGEKFLVMVDWATHYCQAKWIKDKKPSNIMECIMEKWISYFGAPQKIITDGGREFQNEEIIEFTEKWGIEMLCTASESPWSNGKSEKTVGILKEGMRKLKEDGVKGRDWKLMWMVSAKNDRIMNGGYSPNQKVFGIYYRGKNEMEKCSPAELEEGMDGAKLKELMELQMLVKDKVQEKECRDRIRRALKGKIRAHRIEEAQVGDKVFYKKIGEEKWRGPGRIIGRDGKVVFVKHGALIREVNKIHITKLQKANEMIKRKEKKREAIEEKNEEVEDERDDDSEEEEEEEEDEEEEEREEELLQEEEEREEELLQEEVDDERNEFSEDEKVHPYDIRKGSNYRIRHEDEDWWRRVKVISLGGKRGGKFDGTYNVKDLDSEEEFWADLREYEVEKDKGEQGEKYFSKGKIVTFKNKETDNTEQIKEAKQKEISSWKENNVFEEIDGDKENKVLKTRWIITEKEKEGDKICKARLVVKGFMEKECLDIEDSEAPTFSIEGLKVILAIINMKDWQVKTLDVKTAYLQGKEIEKEVVIKPPEEANTSKLWKLKKAVYGLKDAARKWYESLVELLIRIGGKRSKIDNTIFKWEDDGIIYGIMGIHVDDLIYGGNKIFEEKVISKIKEELKVGREESGIFKYLGIEIEQEEKGDIYISQKSYSRDKLGIIRLNKNNKDERLNEEEMTEYRSLLGKLNWMSQNTRPDLSFEVSFFGRNMKEAKREDYEKLVKVAERAKRGEIQMKIPKLKGGRMRLEVYSDASFGNVSEGRTQIGYCIRMKDMTGNCCPLLWKSKVAKRVVSSTLSAETLSMVEAKEWGEYIKYLWEELTNINTSDNIEIIAMTDCKSLRDSVKSTKGVKNRILRIELANLKEKLENRIIKSIEWVNSRLQIADGLTKKDNRKNMVELRKALGCN